MSENDKKPPARALFRKLALASAIVCFLLAGFYGFGVIHAPPPAPQQGHNWGAVGLWLLFGFVLVTIWKTGYWPPKW